MSRRETVDKLALIEERKKKWMANKTIDSIQSETQREVANERRAMMENSKPSSTQASYNAPYTDSDLFLSKLTDKLTVHIREEIQKELSNSISSHEVRDSVSSKMDSYLSAELSTHTCKICFELMVSPNNTPVLLFPCGHTFCKQCIDQVTRTNKGCPYCRGPIESKAVNQSLKDLIDQFAKQKSMVEGKAGVHLDQVFQHSGPSSPNRRGGQYSSGGDRGSGVSGHSNNNNSSGSSSGIASGGDGKHYMAQYKSCEMRYTILYNEYMENNMEVEAIRKKKHKLRMASDHLLEERNKLDAKILLLQEERQLINEHLDNQAGKQRDVEQIETEMQTKSQMLKNSLGNLESDMERLNILIKGST